MKKFLLGLFIVGLSFIGFSSAGSYTTTQNLTGKTVGNSVDFLVFNIPYKEYVKSNINISCHISKLDSYSSDNPSIRFVFYGLSNNRLYSNSLFYIQDLKANQIFYSGSNFNFTVDSTNFPEIFYSLLYMTVRPSGNSINLGDMTISCTFEGDGILGDCPSCPICPSTGEILSGYVEQSQLLSCQENLNSCQSSLSGYDNTLNGCSDSLISCQSSLNSCIQGNCPIDTGSVMWSAMFINGIQFPGYGLINVNIPDYITWDYSVNEDQFDLDVGSGYDVEYIESIIDINSYRPSSSDFTTIFVSGFTFIMPYIIFSLFLVFMRKLLKRIFK